MASSSSRRKRLPQFQDRLILGDQGLRVSLICLGWVRSAETVVAAFEAGINFFFITTDLHWPGYEATRRGVRELLARGPEIREQIVVAGVCYQTRPIFCSGPFQELLEEMPGLERLDVLIAGAVYADELGKWYPVYQRHRDRGFQRAQIRGLAADLPALWHAPSPRPSDRQAILRQVLERVEVTVPDGKERVEVTLCWVGGYESRHEVRRPVSSYRRLHDWEAIKDQICALKQQGLSYAKVAPRTSK